MKITLAAQRSLNEKLFEAAEAGDAALVRRLLASGARANARNQRGATALMAAAAAGNAECVAVLTPLTNVAAKCRREGRTALMWAAAQGRVKCVKLLLPRSDALDVSVHGWTSLMLAVEYGSLACVEALFPASVPSEPGSVASQAMTWSLATAASEGRWKIAQALLPWADLAPARGGRAVLMDAVHGQAGKCVDLLLPSADLDARDRSGFTAMELAEVMGGVGLAARIGAERARREVEAMSAGLGSNPASSKEKSKRL